MLILADAGGVDFGFFAQYGVLGMVFIAVVLGPLVPWRFYTRERDRADKLEEAFVNEILPASHAMLEAAKHMMDYLARGPRR